MLVIISFLFSMIDWQERLICVLALKGLLINIATLTSSIDLETR